MSVPLTVLVQIACVVALVSVGTMLMVVGALGSGLVCLLGSGVWFWRLYRDSGP
ncbi:hypothetical protein [Rhodococcus sp. IEGM 1351]|uniref:hypothetical protein n=1 Tax=Rhodococcus sp. IEGM 1351 TaxID=3047089 RepID=UPI0024B860D2|nr:hypothetical protein [Rhodococcus sp. IEGM 1351]